MCDKCSPNQQKVIDFDVDEFIDGLATEHPDMTALLNQYRSRLTDLQEQSLSHDVDMFDVFDSNINEVKTVVENPAATEPAAVAIATGPEVSINFGILRGGDELVTHRNTNAEPIDEIAPPMSNEEVMRLFSEDNLKSPGVEEDDLEYLRWSEEGDSL